MQKDNDLLDEIEEKKTKNITNIYKEQLQNLIITKKELWKKKKEFIHLQLEMSLQNI